MYHTSANVPFTLRSLFLCQRLCAGVCGCCVRFANRSLRVIGFVLAVIAVTLIALITYSFFIDIQPRLYQFYSPVAVQLLSLLGLYIAFQITFHYVSCMLTGRRNSVPLSIEAHILALQRDDPDLYLSNLRRRNVGLEESRLYRFCSACQNVKPMRTHHCSICNKCVLKMDHHCPWMNSCIGYWNHRHFILFLFYVVFGCIFVLFLSSDQLVSVLTEQNNEPFTMLASIILCTAIGIAAGVFLIWSLYLVLTNQTTVEFYANVFERLDNKGRKVKSQLYPFSISRRKNLQTVFGVDLLKSVLLPVWTSPVSVHQGLAYELAPSYKNQLQATGRPHRGVTNEMTLLTGVRVV